MKVLFNNLVKDATITALSENANYPAENLASQFLKLKYKSTGIDDTITVTFDDSVTADCFFYSYTNATSMTIKLYSSGSVLLDTITVDCTYSSGSEYFTSQNSVRWFTIEAACPATEDLYIGGIGFGVSTDFPYPTANFAKQIIDNSESDTSTDGQVANQYIEPLTSYTMSFYGVERSEYHSIFSLFKSVGSGHIWIDIAESNHAVYQPLYCITKTLENPSRDETISFKCTFMEAR